VHTHHIINAEAFSYLRMTKDTEEIFLAYFEDGMTPSAAKDFHEICLLEQNAESGDIMQVLSNAQVNPTSTQIYGLYNKHR
jgi:hypothetical protein